VDTGLNFDTSKTTHDTSLAPLQAGTNYIQFRVDLPIAYNQDLNGSSPRLWGARIST